MKINHPGIRTIRWWNPVEVARFAHVRAAAFATKGRRQRGKKPSRVMYLFLLYEGVFRMVFAPHDVIVDTERRALLTGSGSATPVLAAAGTFLGAAVVMGPSVLAAVLIAPGSPVGFVLALVPPLAFLGSASSKVSAAWNTRRVAPWYVGDLAALSAAGASRLLRVLTRHADTHAVTAVAQVNIHTCGHDHQPVEVDTPAGAVDVVRCARPLLRVYTSLGFVPTHATRKRLILVRQPQAVVIDLTEPARSEQGDLASAVPTLRHDR